MQKRIKFSFSRKMICLSKQGQRNTPTRAELVILDEAGLGERKVVFTDKNGTHDHIRQSLEKYYPK